MRMVGWDVSAGDWATSNPRTIADRVLRKVRGGSIIDLHDGLDGRVNVDRRVLVQAMPLILDGLRARGLHAVRLDQLIGISGYRGGC
jgi:peptidoglycan/xylan/chitin deacetylase (PgdA/CDA1 family)